MPIHELPDQLNEAPDGQLWVHCGSGYRAAIASSILERTGRRVVHVDDNWPPPEDLGLRLRTSAQRPTKQDGR